MDSSSSQAKKYTNDRPSESAAQVLRLIGNAREKRLVTRCGIDRRTITATSDDRPKHQAGPLNSHHNGCRGQKVSALTAQDLLGRINVDVLRFDLIPQLSVGEVGTRREGSASVAAELV